MTIHFSNGNKTNDNTFMCDYPMIRIRLFISIASLIGLRLTGYTQSQANSATIYNLQTNPVFRHDPYPNMTYIPSNSQINEMLAKGIPALSGPAGSRPILLKDKTCINVDLNHIVRINSWPSEKHIEFTNQWLHSDIKNVAYRFLFPIFDQIVTEGSLK